MSFCKFIFLFLIVVVIGFRQDKESRIGEKDYYKYNNMFKDILIRSDRLIAVISSKLAIKEFAIF